ncbi:hypothetical protein ACFQ9R_05600 [Nocardia sp. NPDC056541]|uniref:hypothetical protein n=1 Tax=Nocardia sp. NPDC056541 TaxID=3345860 RepID=UPI00366AB21B
MGGFRKWTKAELEQREKDQHNPEWLAWLADMDAGLETFFAVDVRDMPVEPFTAAGLDHAEQALLHRFSSSDSLLDVKNAGMVDRFHRYLGETFIKSGFEGRWMNVRITSGRGTGVFFDRRGFEPVVREPFTDSYLEVVMLALAAVERRTGHEWSWVYRNAEEDYAEWVDNGRPNIS